MGKQEAIGAKPLRADVLRRMVAEWIAQGCTVDIKPDGAIRVTPPDQQPKDAFDAVDFRR